MPSIPSVFAEIYDAFAPEYERTRVPRFRPFVKNLLQFYDTRPKSSVLDAGTGTGLAATLVAPRVGREGRVVGVDVSEGQLEIARHKAKQFGFAQCEFVVGDINALDFSNSEFDLIICSFALQGEPAHLFSEFRRLLKPEGGVLLCQEWAPAHAAPESAYDDLIRRNRVTSPGERLARFRAVREQHRKEWDPIATPAEYERLLKQLGFGHVQARAEILPQHFDSARAYIEWREMEPVHRAELDAMEPEAREGLLDRAEVELHQFETTKGMDIDWTATQVMARL